METKPYQRVWLEEAAPGETFIYKEGKAEREDVQNADIILGNVSPKLISTGDKLKWLQTNSAGVDGYIHGCLPEETVMVGDQIFTDTLGACRAGVVPLLVEPIRLAGNPGRYLRYAVETPFRLLGKRRPFV